MRAAAALLLCVLAVPVSAAESKDAGCPVVFEDVAAAAGLRFQHERGATPNHQLPETMGSGVAWLDYDNDGWMDLYVVQSGKFEGSGLHGKPKRRTREDGFATLRSNVASGDLTPAHDRLYRNNGNGTFTDVTARAKISESGYGMGAIAADYDNDGFTDVFVTNFERNTLFRNNGDGTFADVTDRARLAGTGWATSAAFADFDGDGYLDLFVVRYLDYSVEKNYFCGDRVTGRRDYCHPTLYPAISNLLYRNKRDGTFEDVTASSGISSALGKGLGVIVSDVDSDGKPDVYVANDTTMNFLFRNLGGMRFEDVSILSGAGVNSAGRAFGGMGTNAGDLDGDGHPDLVVANFEAEPNSFYRNVGEGIFEDASAVSGFGPPAFNFSGFGLNLLDAANAGRLDAFIANGHVLEVPKMQGVTYAERPFLMWNDGKGKFVERGCGDPFRRELVGRGSAVADYDNDGDIDVAVSNSGGPLQLLRNDGKHGNWVGFQLVGRKSNRQGVGARVTVETDRGKQVREARAGESYLSSSDPRIHFGLGDATSIRRVEIRWPSGTVQEFRDARPGKYVRVEEPATASQ